MRVFFFLTTLILLAAPSIAGAQSLFEFGKSSAPQTTLFPEEKGTADEDQHLSRFYENCLSIHQDGALPEYGQEQCACTAAEISQFMTPENLQAVPEDTTEGNIQASRLYTLGYLPCLETTVRHFVYDGCINNPASSYQKEIKVFCGCMGSEMGEFTAGLADFFQSQNYDPARFKNYFIPRNPLSYFMSLETFNIQYKYYNQQCMQKLIYKTPS